MKRRTQQLEAQPRPAPAPSPLQPAPAAGGKLYTQRSVAELRELYAGGEAAPGTPPAADETGKWIETTSMRVVGIAGGGVLLLKKDNSNIQCAFAEAAKAKLATLRVGDAVRVSGKINQDQNGQLVNLEECELKRSRRATASCHDWREADTSHPPFWTRTLDLRNQFLETAEQQFSFGI